jgi:hypothetical protein
VGRSFVARSEEVRPASESDKPDHPNRSNALGRVTVLEVSSLFGMLEFEEATLNGETARVVVRASNGEEPASPVGAVRQCLRRKWEG